MCAEKIPSENTELFLQVGEVDVHARVVWTSDDQCGLRFEQEIRDWDVELLSYEANRGTKATLHAAERGGVDDWATGVAR